MGLPTKTIEFEKQDVVQCDERGRATLGSEYADEQVFVWVAPAPDMAEVSEYEYLEGNDREVARRLLRWANENDIEVWDVDIMAGEIEDKNGETYEGPCYVDTTTGEIRER